jgi:hypothetical protein
MAIEAGVGYVALDWAGAAGSQVVSAEFVSAELGESGGGEQQND